MASETVRSGPRLVTALGGAVAVCLGIAVGVTDASSHVLLFGAALVLLAAALGSRTAVLWVLGCAAVGGVFALVMRDGLGQDAGIALPAAYVVVTVGAEVLLFVRGRMLRKAGRPSVEERLRDSERVLRLISENARDVVWITDTETRVTFVTESAERVLGYPPSDAIGMTISGFLTPESSAVVEERIHERLAGRKGVRAGTRVYEYDLVRKDGSVVPCESSVEPLFDDAGEVTGFVGVTRDISARRQALDQLRRREAVLEAVAHAGQRLVATEDWTSELPGMLARLGEASQSDTVAVFANRRGPDGDLLQTGLARWTTVGGADTMESDERLGLSWEKEGFSDWRERLARGEVIAGNTADFGQKPRAFFEQRGRKAVVLVPVFAGAEWWGTIGFSMFEEHTWVPAEIDALKAAGALLGAAVVRHRVEEARLASETRLQEAQSAAHLGIWHYSIPETRLAWSAETFRICGFSPNSFTPTINACIEGVLPPGEQERVVSEIAEAARTGAPRAFDHTIVRPDQSVRHVHERVMPERGKDGVVRGLLGTVLDITERKEAEQALQASEELYRLLAENVTDMLSRHDTDTTCLYVSPVCKRILGYEPEEVVGHAVFEFCHPDDLEVLRGFQGALLRDPAEATAEYRLKTKDRGYVWIETRGSVMHPDEEDPEVVVITRDITERKRAEKEREELEQQIQHAQKLESLGVLAGGIAHDFNNLLMGILGNAEIALTELAPGSAARENVAEVEAAAMRAAELCRQMLAYSGKGRFDVKVLDLSEAVREMQQLLQVSVSKKALLNYSFGEDLPHIEADATQIRQVVMNLVTNASDALSESSGTIAVSTGAMECDRAARNAVYFGEPQKDRLYVYLEVADTGIGMDAETQGRIFDPFFTTKFTGRGLGLAAVLGIVRGHRGAIRVDSRKGRGTTVRVLFPASERRAAGPASAATEPGLFEGLGTLLVVDDEETVRVLTKRMLEGLGFTVITAEDGRQAVDLFRERRHEIHGVLMDMTMPHMNGDEALVEMRRIRPALPAILASGYDEQEAASRFANDEHYAFLHKPYRRNELIDRIRQVLDCGLDGGER